MAKAGEKQRERKEKKHQRRTLRDTNTNDRKRAQQSGRGRRASGPSEIPKRGWWDILLRTYDQLMEDYVGLVAAGVAFYSLLALFPLLAALVSIYGLFAPANVIQDHLALLAGFLPSAAIDMINEQLGALLAAGTPSLSLVFIAATLFSLWSANQGVTAMFDAMNIAYGEMEKRSFVRRRLITLLFTFAFIVFVMISLVAIVAVPPLLEFVQLPADAHWILSLARWPILLAILLTANAIIYRYGPSREEAQWRWLSWGSVAAAVLWMATSAGFSFYAAHFASYNKTYGSMGAIVALMTWIWLSAYIVIAGAELNAEIEHQTSRDTTTGKPKALGARGAQMADTVGEAKS